jgi:acyl-CoA hydrolase
MGFFKQGSIMEGLRTEYPEKFTSADKAFKNIQRGNKIYIGTAAGEPKHLVRSLMEYLNQISFGFSPLFVIMIFLVVPCR